MKHEYFKFLAATVSGNIMEWYDFALYGYFATIIGKLFFPSSELFFSLLLTFSTFGVGVIARLFGSLFFGYIGDCYGRRFSLLISIVFISFSTLCIGLLPTYASIGVLAPILLVICRLLQGLAVGGELTTAGIYLVECGANNRQGFNGSLVMCSTYVGLLLGAVVCTLVTSFCTTQAIETVAWRIPFILSFFLGLLAIGLRFKTQDSPIFEALLLENKCVLKPIALVFKGFVPHICIIGIMSSILAVAIYLLIGYFPAYFMTHLSMSSSQSMLTVICGLLSLATLVPLLGYLSDRVGYHKLYISGCLLFVTFSCAFLKLWHDGLIHSACLSTILFTIPLAFIAASIMPIIINLFPSYVRCTGVAIAYGSSMAIFGGTAPVVALVGSRYFETSLVPIVYLIVIASLSLVGVCYLHKISRRSEYVLQEEL